MLTCFLRNLLSSSGQLNHFLSSIPLVVLDRRFTVCLHTSVQQGNDVFTGLLDNLDGPTSYCVNLYAVFNNLKKYLLA